MVRIDCPGSLNSYVLKIGFKRWGKLWTPGNLRLYSLPEAARREAWDYRVGTAVHGLKMFGAAGTLIANKRFALKNTLASGAVHRTSCRHRLSWSVTTLETRPSRCH